MKNLQRKIRKNYKKIIGVGVILLGIFLVWNLFANQAQKMESMEEIHEKVNNTEFIFLKGTPSIIDEDKEQNFSKIIVDENEIKEIVEILKTTEVKDTTQNVIELPLNFFYIYTLVLYDQDGKPIDEYVFYPQKLYVIRTDDDRLFELSEEKHYALLEILEKSIKPEPDFSLVFNNVLENPIEIITLSDGRKVYSFFEENEVTNQDKVVKSLQDALKEDELLLNEMISYMQYETSLNDGGSAVFKADSIPTYKSRLYVNREFYIALCNTLSGDKDIYIGSDVSVATWCRNSE